MGIDYSKVKAKEIWSSVRPKQKVIIGEDDDLAIELSKECKGNVEVVDKAEGNEYLFSHLSCEFRDGEVLDPPQPFVYPEDLPTLFGFFELDKVYIDKTNNTLNILAGESRFDKLIVIKELERRGYSRVEVVTSEHKGELLWENLSLESRLRSRLVEAGVTKAYALGEYPNWTVLTTDAKKALDLHDILPDVTTATMSWANRPKSASDSQCVFSKGVIMCELE